MTVSTGQVWQYDFGQILRIEGLGLPDAVEVHFSLQKTGGEAKRRIGVTKDGVTDVRIPDFILEEESSVKYEAYAFIYESDRIHGNTTKKIVMEIEARPKPEAFNKPCEAQIFQDTIEAVRESMAGAEAAEELACYENYTKFDAVVKYTAGILGIVMYQEEQAPEDRIKALEKEKNEIQEKINQLEGCILEMSEQVYQ